MSGDSKQAPEVARRRVVQAAVDVPPKRRRTEVGVIPLGWDVRRIGTLFSVNAGGDFDPPNSGDGQTEILKYPIYANGLAERGLHGYYNRSSAEAGSITVTARGTLGRAFFRTTPFMAIGRLLVLRPKIVMDARFFAEFINHGVQFAIESTGVPQLTAPQIATYLLPVPPLDEQAAIAGALSEVDRLLEALEALIAKKRAIKQAAMQQLLTGRTRLPGFSGGWETKRLGDHVLFLRHGVYSRAELTNTGAVRYLHYGDVHGARDAYLDPGSCQMPWLSADRARALDRLEDGDLVLVDASEDLEGVGKSVEIMGVRGSEVVSGLHTIAARFDKAMLADGFKAYLQFCPRFRQHLRRLAAGTKVYATNRAHIATAEMPLPDVSEQMAIAGVLSDMNAEIAALEARHVKTRAIKQGMMQQLLTGQVRLVTPSQEVQPA